jgi:voltage-gated potassium channel
MTEEAGQRRGIGTRWLAAMRRHRFDLLLGALVLLMVSAPVVHLLGPQSSPVLTRIAVTVVFTLVLLSAVFAVCQTRRSVALGLWLVVPAVLLHELRLHIEWDGLVALAHLLSVCFLGYTIVVMLRFLFAPQPVTLNMIYASLCVYLLLGVLWANVYSLMGVIEPNSFAFALDVGRGAERMRFGAGYSVYPIYYSFVTLSTLGYGDIVPASSAARMFAATEAITGQLYLAVLVARLVGLHISQTSSGTKRSEAGRSRVVGEEQKREKGEEGQE